MVLKKKKFLNFDVIELITNVIFLFFIVIPQCNFYFILICWLFNSTSFAIPFPTILRSVDL